MPGTFHVDIVTPEKVILREEAVSLRAPGVEGSFGLLVNHSPLLAELTAGELRLRKPGGEEIDLAVGGGFLQVFDNKVTVLADTAERLDEIDVERARRAKEVAREALKAAQATYNQIAIDQAQAALDRADNRIRLGS
jgi:F-type H+-transporting ATPase subunit epsilon